MNHYTVKRQFRSLVVTGIVAACLAFVATVLYWPFWASAAKTIITPLAAQGLQEVDGKTAAKYVGLFAEATFFWLIISPWIWQSLLFGGYGKNRITERQPWAGVWYTLVGALGGVVAFLVIVGFLGLWWRPFNFGTLLFPRTPEEVHLAIEGWETSNFYTLTVIMVQIPFASLLQKWPFAERIAPPWDGFGVMMTSTLAALLVWLGTVVPSLMSLTLGAHPAVVKPFGGWPTFVAFCQVFIWCAIIPAEGGEQYPMRFFARRQPYMAFAGFVISLAMAFLIPPALRPVVARLDLLPGAPPDLVIASLFLSVIVTTLMWHHLFDDFPTAKMVPNQAARILTRLGIWVVAGFSLGVGWLKMFKMLPFGGNDLGLGFPVMGLLAGQFAFLMVFLYFNTFFDKWPLVRKVALKSVEKQAVSARD
jgi:AAT family amino acid transporter